MINVYFFNFAVQASVGANTYVVSGQSETKSECTIIPDRSTTINATHSQESSCHALFGVVSVSAIEIEYTAA